MGDNARTERVASNAPAALDMTENDVNQAIQKETLILIVSKSELSFSDVDECASSICMNGGQCTNKVGSFECACVPGFDGQRCEAGRLPYYMDML